MGLETVTYISDLVTTNPVGATDQKAQGDDHLRAIKTGLLGSFPNFVGAAMTLTEAQLNDAARKSAAQTISGAWTFTANPSIAKADPVPVLKDTSGGASDMTAYLSLTDNADTERGYLGFASGSTLMSIVNSIGQITISGNGEIQLDATTLDFNGNVDISGDLIVAGAIYSPDATGGLTVAGGNSSGDGANIELYGGSHATLASQAYYDASSHFFRSQSGGTATELQIDATTIDLNGNVLLSAAATVPDGFNGGYASEGGDWGASIWALSTSFDGGPAGNDSAISGMYGLKWLRATHASAVNAGEGLHVVINGTIYQAFGASGVYSRGALVTPNTDASEIGYKGAPFNTQDGNYGLVLTDCGKCIRYNGAGGHTYTIPANASIAYPQGTEIQILNISANALTIAITTDTLVFAGVGSTGSRTLAANGWATIVKYTTTGWYISGVGVS